MTAAVELLAGWPLAASIAAAMTARGLRGGRRRSALNEALHELRRPLQSIALAADSDATPPVVESSVQLATAALARLEREINGSGRRPPREVFPVRPLVESAVARWKGRASLGGGSLTLRWRAEDVVVAADRLGLAQAIDNLIVNAIEHGGPSIVVEASRRGDRLRLAVADSGRASRPPSRRETPGEIVARLSGRRRRGHGLAVVGRTAATHGGRFALRRSEGGSHAVLELPLDRDAVGPAA